MNSRFHLPPWLALGLALVALSSTATGHSPREDYLYLSFHEGGEVKGRFELHSVDLEKLGINIAHDDAGLASLTSAEESAGKVNAYLAKHYVIKADGQAIAPDFTTISFVNEVGTFVQYHFTAKVARPPAKLSFQHNLFYEHDPLHRGLFLLENNPVDGTEYGDLNVALIFSESNRTQDLDLGVSMQSLLTPNGFMRHGVQVSLRRADQLVFLLLIILPGVLRLRKGKLEPADSLWKAGRRSTLMLALFALGYGITLGLESRGWLLAPLQLAEIGMAALILFASISNLFPKLTRALPLVALGFGLLLGIVLAAELSLLPYRMPHLKDVLLKFAIGIGIVQLAFTVPLFLLFFAIRNSERYQSTILRGVSALTLFAGMFWLMERSLGV